MNILIISECTKNALKESRRLIDQFAERTGRRTWQTAITNEGLKTLHRLLRKTARKNTAVACFWTRGKNRTELLWVVGDKSRFNDRGRVPTSRTGRNILRSEDESAWQDGKTIQILATLAALLHDLGKATVGFQEKLSLSTQKKRAEADFYRHEWISLQLFLLMIEGCNTNQEILERLQRFSHFQENNPHWYKVLSELTPARKDQQNLSKKPALAQIIGWLIVTHHRLPFLDKSYYAPTDLREKRKEAKYLQGLAYQPYFAYCIKALDNWVKQSWSKHQSPEDFWQLKASITDNEMWLKELRRWATKGLYHLEDLPEKTIKNPLLYTLSRLVLMVGDHNYSSLDKEASEQLVKSEETSKLWANTERKYPEFKQTLPQHLVGVSRMAANFGHLLPYLTYELPALPEHRPLIKPTKIERFTWQNKAYTLAEQLAAKSQTQGFFGVNMASTGCGKTIGNARIMYALRDKELGARFTIALGLRVLTLQTGSNLREQLKLNDDALAVLVGGSAQKTLFELKEEKEQQKVLTDTGSESMEDLIDGEVYVTEGGTRLEKFKTLLADSKARKLLTSPVVTCTIDHLMGASETARGGRHIVPILRLLTSDLILDEPDDFSPEDLPALARLVHLAGLFGSRVLLSSATLTPDLITGLFDAYQSGYRLWQSSRQSQTPNLPIICAWFDEFEAVAKEIQAVEVDIYREAHQGYVDKRVTALKALQIEGSKRQGFVLPLEAIKDKKDIHTSLARMILDEAQALHNIYHTKIAEKKLSFGLVRIAHIKEIIKLARVLYRVHMEDKETTIHLTLYHSRQVLILRNSLEEALDRILNRKNPTAIMHHPEVAEAIKKSPAQNHIFIVLGSPVTEVGRDHDYDWAIVEPSSQRSIIQLVGRVWRHRDLRVQEKPNVALLPAPIKALKQEDLKINTAVFHYPGFEEAPDFMLASHQTAEVIKPHELASIDSIPRIAKETAPSLEVEGEKERYPNLSALEHGFMKYLFNPVQVNFVNCFWQPELAHHLTIHQRLITPFRHSRRETLFFVEPDVESPQRLPYTIREVESASQNLFSSLGSNNEQIKVQALNFAENPAIFPWLTFDLKEELQNLADELGETSLTYLAFKYAQISLDMIGRGGNSKTWLFHPWLGFWEEKEEKN